MTYATFAEGSAAAKMLKSTAVVTPPFSTNYAS